MWLHPRLTDLQHRISIRYFYNNLLKYHPCSLWSQSHTSEGHNICTAGLQAQSVWRKKQYLSLSRHELHQPLKNHLARKDNNKNAKWINETTDFLQSLHPVLQFQMYWGHGLWGFIAAEIFLTTNQTPPPPTPK